MSFEAGVVVAFEAAHRLRGDFGPATRAHGHTYRVEVTVSGERLRDDGTLVDLGALRAAAEAAVAPLHLRDLDGVEGLAGRNTTAEIVAAHVADDVAARLGALALGLAVRVWESPSAFAGCARRLG